MKNTIFSKVWLVGGGFLAASLLLWTMVRDIKGAAMQDGFDQETETPPAYQVKGWIVGRVLDQDGIALDGAILIIISTTASEPIPEIAPVSDKEGRFRFPSLPVGEYELKASAEGKQPQVLRVRVQDQTQSEVEFRLRS